jgi:hypothetical protein
MKNSISIFFRCLGLTLLLLIHATLSWAQAPQGIPYQAIARDGNGTALVSQPIAIRFTLRNINATGSIVFQETHAAATTSLGLFTLNIGEGTPTSGTFTGIDWANGAKYLQVEYDPTGGSNFTDMGTTQLMSVPYALHAGTSGGDQWTINGNDISNTNIGNVGIGTATPESRLEVKYLNAGSAIPTARIVHHNCGAPCAQANGAALQLVNDNPSGIDQGARLSFADPVNVINTDEGAASINLVERNSITGNGGLGFSTRNSANSFGERMRISKEGNLGLGTTEPQAQLHINDINGAQNAPSAGMILARSWSNIYDTRASSIFHYYNGNTYQDNLGFAVAGDGGSFSSPNSLSQIKMMIQGNGNVGIGTITPTHKLMVDGNFRVNHTGYGIVQDDGIISVGTYSDGSAGWFGTNSNHPLYFYTANGYESMAITQGGNIGMGTNAPNEKLSVVGTTGLYGNTVISPSLNGSLGTLSVGNPTLYTNSMLNVKSNLQYAAFIDGATTTSAALQVEGRTKLNGNVSIGSGAGFASGYRLSVDGKIICTELRVQATPFPDYVFASDYKLKPLDEVEEHINTHHRLPNMPPAAEVESEGMSVGGIQLKLVEKVEELTLYLLQQQKQLKEQQAEITRLHHSLNELKN